MTKIALDRQRRVPEQVYDIVRDRILTGQIAPGETINERRLTEWFDVSRTPIREALRRLTDEGLTEVIPSVGSKVTEINLTRIYELALIRIELECLVIRKAAPHFTTEIKTELLALIDGQTQTVSTGDNLLNIKIDSQFHAVIHQLSGMKTVTEFLHRVMAEILRARHKSILVPGRLDDPIREHLAIVTALETQDPARSDTAMRDHLTASYNSIVEALEAK